MKRKLLTFTLLLVLSLATSCSETPSNNYIPTHDKSGDVSVTGIDTPGNFLRISKESDVDKFYDISAVAMPSNATDKTLKYVSSDNQTAEIDSNGVMRLKKTGTVEVDIISASSKVSQKVIYDIVEKQITTVDIENNPQSIFGKYNVLQYGVNIAPNKNISGSEFDLNIEKSIQDNSKSIISKLLFNGVYFSFDFSKIENIENKSYNDIALEMVQSLSLEKKSDKSIIIVLSTEEYPELVSNDFLKKGDKLYLLLEKQEDYYAGTHVGNSGIKATQINMISKNITIDRANDSTYMISSIVKPENATNKELVYKSITPDILEVTDMGIIKALGKGKGQIEVFLKENPAVKSNITVNVIDNSIIVDKVLFTHTVDKLQIDKSYTFKAQVYPDNASNKLIEYSSSNPLIAKVNSATGEVTALRKGSVYIKAKSLSSGKEVSHKVEVSAFTFNAEAIMNIPKSVNIKVTNTLQLNAEVFPSYASDKGLIYTIDNESIASISSTGLIEGKSIGEALVRVTSSQNQNIYRDVKVAVRDNVPDVDVTEIIFNDVPNNLYIGLTEFTLSASYNEGANINNVFSIEADKPDIIDIYENGVNSWILSPLAEGMVNITVSSPNGVSKKVAITVHKVMNIKGYYTIDYVEYSLNDTKNSFYPSRDSEVKDKLQGEFAVNILEDKIVAQGRLQFKPLNPKETYMFNNWRYLYINKEIPLDDNDKYFAQIKSELAKYNINIISENKIEIIYTDGAFQGKLYFTKVSDKTKEITDRTIFMSDIDVENDPHSIEGYYQMTFFYGNPKNSSSTGYQPLFSGKGSDRPSSSDLGITYLQNGRKCGWIFTCLGGNGPDGSVTNYKGEFAVQVSGTNEQGELTSIMKVQKQGHHDYDFSKWLKYIHGKFDKIKYSQNSVNNKVLVNKQGKVFLTSNNGNEGQTNAAIAYRIVDNTTLQFEVNFWNYYKYTYRAKKISDRYIDLPTSKFVRGDVSDRTPAPIPDMVKVEPVMPIDDDVVTSIY